MKNFFSQNILIPMYGFLVTIFLIIVVTFCITVKITSAADDNNVTNAQFGGNAPMKIYTVIDRDTGVYYAVTEQGGICVMLTMTGETKLVDEGEPPIIHPNQGYADAA